MQRDFRRRMASRKRSVGTICPPYAHHMFYVSIYMHPYLLLASPPKLLLPLAASIACCLVCVVTGSGCGAGGCVFLCGGDV
jgi:hypothetical protein